MVRLSTGQRLGLSAVAMLAVSSLLAVLAAVYFDVTGPAANDAALLVPEGLVAAWAAIGLVFGAGLLSLLPPLLFSEGGGGADPGAGAGAAPLGFQAGMLVRLFVTLAGALVGAVALQLPPRPFLLTLAVTYLALLPAELIGLPGVGRGASKE